MRLVNKSNKIILANKVRICKTFFSRFMGLMFSNGLKDNEALVIVSNKESISMSSIHTFFVFFSIDVVWLNNDFEVVDLRSNLLPFRLFISPKVKARYIVELNKGKSISIKLGDRLMLV